MSTTITLGRQAFDGLGRQRTVEIAGRVTHYHYQSGQLPPTANTLADGKRVSFTYEPALDNALLSTEAEGCDAQRLDYDPLLGVPIRASGDLGQQQWLFNRSGQAQADTWKVDDLEHRTTWQHSLNGLLLGFEDNAGVEHRRTHDACGRLIELRVGDVISHFTYDPLSRLDSVSTADPQSGQTLHKQLAYDPMGREQRCTFTLSGPEHNRRFVQTLTWTALDQLRSRTWSDGEQHAEETFAYDLRGRLVQYNANPLAAAQDPFGNAIVEQRFAFDALDSYQRIVTTFTDGSQDIATYHYAEHDPCQVAAISHSHPSWPALIELSYDACGRLISDSLGRTLTWDAHDRLIQVALDGRACNYRYDASGQLRDRELDGQLNRSFFSATQLTHEHQGEARLGLIGDGTMLFATRQLAGAKSQTTLLGCDSQGSVRLECAQTVGQRHYSAHGLEHHEDDHSPFGYAGERRDPLTGWLIPGGYRPYDPLLMLFLAPDSDSPFGRGGINAYTYCGGDPVNRIDPDGHSWGAWAITGAGLLISAAVTVSSFGTALPALSLVMAGGLGALSASNALAIGSAALCAVSLGTGVAAAGLEAGDRNSKAAGILGAISLGTGLAASVLRMVPAGAALVTRQSAEAGRAASKLAGFKPYRVGPGGNTRPASVLYASTRNGNDVAFIPNLYGEGNAAFVTHGSPLGKLMNAQGLADDPANIARNLIAPRLAEMGYPAEQKIVLLACWGGKSGAAQKIANELGRPVEAFSQKIFLKSTATLQMPRAYAPLWADGVTNVPITKPSLPARGWRHLLGHFPTFSDRPYDIAKSATYFPH